MVIAMSVLILCGMEIIKVMSRNEYTAGWFQSGINSISNFLAGNKSYDNSNDAMSALFNDDFWKLPPFPRVLIGTGHSLYLAEGYNHSDVGYINEIWIWGIIGCVVFYGTIIKQCGVLMRNKNQLYSFIGIFLMLSYFFFNINAAALGYKPGPAGW